MICALHFGLYYVFILRLIFKKHLKQTFAYSQVVAGYTVEAIIGEGSFGKVYQVRRTQPGGNMPTGEKVMTSAMLTIASYILHSLVP